MDEKVEVTNSLNIINKEKYLDFNLIINNNLLTEDKIENNKLKRNSPACIIYTSGTGGNPKGVILSHGGILSNCEGAVELLETLTKKKDPTFLTWLPLSHSYEHTVQFIQIIGILFLLFIGFQFLFKKNQEIIRSRFGKIIQITKIGT